MENILVYLYPQDEDKQYKGFVDFLSIQNGKLSCMLYSPLKVFDEYEYDVETGRLTDAVDKVEQIGMNGINYFKSKYYQEDSYLNEKDIILRFEDNEYYQIDEYIHCSGTIIAYQLIKAFELDNIEGPQFCESLQSTVYVEYLLEELPYNVR